MNQQLELDDTWELPPFVNCKTPLDMSLHILWASKEAGIRRLTSQQISSVLLDAHEVSIEPESISQALKKAGNRIHVHRENGNVLYEIMKAGKEYLISLSDKKDFALIYFEPEKGYSSKRLLSVKILEKLNGCVKIVDPYLGERTLDLITNTQSTSVQFLTKIENIRNESDKARLLRYLQDFKVENKIFEFRNYPFNELHDRYIISPHNIIILGHSMKDLGVKKESFAISLDKVRCNNIYEAINESFDRRWKQSSIL